MSNQDKIKEYFDQHITQAGNVKDRLSEQIEKAATAAIKSLEGSGQILLFGNGGSAADAQHIATEFTGRFIRERRALKAIALTTDSSAITAISNDYGFDHVFSRQIEALASSGDTVIGISTSGNSANVITAFESAKKIGCTTVALLGKGGGKVKSLADIELIVPSDYTPHIQEMHIVIGHLICELVDSHFA